MLHSDLERIAFRRLGQNPTPETILAKSQNPREPRLSDCAGYLDLRAGRKPDRSGYGRNRPRRQSHAPVLENMPAGPCFDVLCRRTGARLWRVRGTPQHVLAQIEKQVRFQGGTLAMVKFVPSEDQA